MTAFIWGVFSSLAASILCTLTAWLYSSKTRIFLISTLSRFTGVGIVQIFTSQSAANRALSKDLTQARWIKVFAGRGNELTRDSFGSLWRESYPVDSVEILLPDPETFDTSSWLDKRAEEMTVHDPGFSGMLLSDQIKNNISYLTIVSERRPEVQIRLYNFPHLGRIIATDKLAYVTLYDSRYHGRNSPCLVFQNTSAMYSFALRIFTLAWNQARPVISTDTP